MGTSHGTSEIDEICRRAAAAQAGALRGGLGEGVWER